jgi:hypothetical protein
VSGTAAPTATGAIGLTLSSLLGSHFAITFSSF